MVRKAVHVKQGDLFGERRAKQESEPPIVAKKRRNGRGAKGGRKVEA